MSQKVQRPAGACISPLPAGVQEKYICGLDRRREARFNWPVIWTLFKFYVKDPGNFGSASDASPAFLYCVSCCLTGYPLFHLNPTCSNHSTPSSPTKYSTLLLCPHFVVCPNEISKILVSFHS